MSLRKESRRALTELMLVSLRYMLTSHHCSLELCVLCALWHQLHALPSHFYYTIYNGIFENLFITKSWDISKSI